MTRKDWLIKKHRELDTQIWEIEKTSNQREDLAFLKKEKLRLKTEIERTK